MATRQASATVSVPRTEARASRLGPVVAAVPHAIGGGFAAHHFSEEMFGGAMDPLLMVDHFVMTEPTFDPHLHAGISAVTVMFEDSHGTFLNRDTLGQNAALEPGDLYWLAAASGAAHEEKPAEGSRIHALQLFVNLPGRLKSCPARALKVDAATVPILKADGHRVRVVLGRSGEAEGAVGTPEEMTLLDGFLSPEGRFVHALPAARQAWIYAVAGTLSVTSGGEERRLEAGTAITVCAGDGVDIAVAGIEDAHFVLTAAKPIQEAFVKRGPLVMSTDADVRRTLADYAEGKFGRVPA